VFSYADVSTLQDIRLIRSKSDLG